jgi:hypothetical protein
MTAELILTWGQWTFAGLGEGTGSDASMPNSAAYCVLIWSTMDQALANKEEGLLETGAELRHYRPDPQYVNM